MAWNQMAFDAEMAEKYRQSAQTSAANAAQARANAALTGAQASTWGADSAAERALKGTQGNLNEAQAYKATEEGNVVKPLADAQIDMWGSQSDENRATADYRRMRSAIEPSLAESQLRLEDSNMQLNLSNSRLNGMNSLLRNRLSGGLNSLSGFKRGIARVPGKGSGDKVPALLEPGEAVLNKHAAGMLGRDKIAKANQQGNQMRSKENLSKLAQALKMMGMA